MPIKRVRRRVFDPFDPPNVSDSSGGSFSPPQPPRKAIKVAKSPSAKAPTSSFPKPHAASPDHPPPKPPNPPPTDSPLWVLVQHTMNQEQYFRHMCKSMTIELKKHKLDIARFKDELSARDEAIAAHMVTANDLREQLSAEKALGESPRKQLDEMKQQLDKSARECKRYRTALAAAFKLVDDLPARTTLAELLEVTDRQLASGSPAKPAAIKMESTLDYGSPRQFTVPCTPVKRERVCNENGQDSEDEPLAKTRRTRKASYHTEVKDE